MHRFRPLASYRYDTALVSPDKLMSPPATPRLADLLKDKQPGYYIYQMTFEDLTGAIRRVDGTYGILELSLGDLKDCTLDVETEAPDVRDHILSHEQTIPAGTQITSDDVSSLVGRPGTGPVWGISVQNKLNVPTIQKGPLRSEVTDKSGVVHKVWQVIESEQMKRIASSVETSQLIIADGHHRIARAMKKLSVSQQGSTVNLLSFITDLAELQAEIRPIHRCFKTRLDRDEIMNRLHQHFEVEHISGAEIMHYQNLDSLVILLSDLALSIKPSAAYGFKNDAFLSQSISRLLEARSTQYLTDISKLRDKVISDPTKVGLINRPVNIDQIREAAINNKPLPPKSTMFYPKPLPGLILGDRLAF
ncbi:MAG: DUF1015 family protein [Actinomycetota bacterium]|nr:MAG: DUF1015 family protein [Actinomycetota bacterium]